MQGFQYLSYYEKLNSFCQCILLDEDARVIDSCNSIFDVSIIADKPVYHTFDFFLGLYNSLYLNNPINTDIRFSKVNAPHPLLQGTYDFTFTNILVKPNTTYFGKFMTSQNYMSIINIISSAKMNWKFIAKR